MIPSLSQALKRGNHRGYAHAGIIGIFLQISQGPKTGLGTFVNLDNSITKGNQAGQ